MICNKPFTKEEFEMFMVGVRERAEQRRREQVFERFCIAGAAVFFAIAIVVTVFA